MKILVEFCAVTQFSDYRFWSIAFLTWLVRRPIVLSGIPSTPSFLLDPPLTLVLGGQDMSVFNKRLREWGSANLPFVAAVWGVGCQVPCLVSTASANRPGRCFVTTFQVGDGKPCLVCAGAAVLCQLGILYTWSQNHHRGLCSVVPAFLISFLG